MKMEIVPCAHPINCDTIFDPHVAEFLQLFVSEGVWHEDGRNNSGAENLSNNDNDSDTQHDWFSDDDLSSCEGESNLYVINVGTRGSVSIPVSNRVVIRRLGGLCRASLRTFWRCRRFGRLGGLGTHGGERSSGGAKGGGGPRRDSSCCRKRREEKVQETVAGKG